MSDQGDLVTFGEVMVRLAPPLGVRLEDARQLEVEVGGAECNVAVAMAGLGRKCAWISKLADNELGRLVLRRVRQTGVDTSRVSWAKGARAGTYFVELGSKPRGAKIIYDRKGSAASQLGPGDIDWDFLAGFAMLHLTGITPSLARGCEQAARLALERAREAGMITSFDVNYRSRLWSPRAALNCLGSMVPQADILFLTMDDARTVFKVRVEPEEVALKMRDEYGPDTIVLTLGPAGAMALHEGEIHRSPGYEVEEIDRIGAGDAFDAGFLHGYLGGDIQGALDVGVAMAALKHTVKGDFLQASEDEVLGLVRGRRPSIMR
jgi:2-dehydro-3-deoxygluconokinase